MQQETTSPSNSGQQMMSPSSAQKIRSTSSDLMSPPPYSPIFFHSANTASPASVNSSLPMTSSATATSAAAISSLSRLMSEHHELLNRHAICLRQLQKTFKEAETLRQENTNLRIANCDLSNHVSLLIQAAAYNQTVPFPDKRRESGWEEGFSSESPTSVMENDRMESQNGDGDNGGGGRVTLPKSISIRSNGFLKMSQGGSGPSGSSVSTGLGGAAKIRATSPVSGAKKVYVRGGSRKDGPIELEVFNQGMFKTELCNKWQETGTCPYGDHCQFAHGIAELRPVIRHPRYKTEVCRMVLAGDPCPYGHRCHFRHALTEQEKLMIPLRLD